jgi:hypothetical protein
VSNSQIKSISTTPQTETEKFNSVCRNCDGSVFCEECSERAADKKEKEQEK